MYIYQEERRTSVRSIAARKKKRNSIQGYGSFGMVREKGKGVIWSLICLFYPNHCGFGVFCCCSF